MISNGLDADHRWLQNDINIKKTTKINTNKQIKTDKQKYKSRQSSKPLYCKVFFCIVCEKVNDKGRRTINNTKSSLGPQTNATINQLLNETDKDAVPICNYL